MLFLLYKSKFIFILSLFSLFFSSAQAQAEDKKLDDVTQNNHEIKKKGQTQTVNYKLTDYYDSQERQMELLKNKVIIAEQSLVVQKRTFQHFGIGSLLLIFGLLGVLFYSQKRLRREQQKKEVELKAALFEVETQNIMQEQRLKIGAELSAKIGAKLAFIISSLDNLKYSFEINDDKLTTKINSISNFTTGAIGELRDTIWAMNKNEITLEDLQLRISNYIDKKELYNSSTNFNFNIDSKLNRDKTFTIIQGFYILYVIQESIYNSLRYANATRLNVEVYKAVSNFVFKIVDNGVGFDVSTLKRGNKIIEMQNQIKRIGGELSINSILSSGTEIIISI